MKKKKKERPVREKDQRNSSVARSVAHRQRRAKSSQQRAESSQRRAQSTTVSWIVATVRWFIATASWSIAVELNRRRLALNGASSMTVWASLATMGAQRRWWFGFGSSTATAVRAQRQRWLGFGSSMATIWELNGDGRESSTATIWELNSDNLGA